jgi:two-component system response regulator YesN
MTVLLVDDQVSILSGLISGIDWDRLGVTSVRTAGNAEKARRILQEEVVDVLLCDIEMPGENGLSLLRWARQQGMDCVCVFLTSHADFLYAKEAIQLGCFDYVLQPARYEDIQATVQKAIDRANSDREEKRLRQIGNMAKDYSAGPLQSLFSEWFSGGELDVTALQTGLTQLGITADQDTNCLLILCAHLRWHGEAWSLQDWTFTLNNVMTETYRTAGDEIVSFNVDYQTIGWLVLQRNTSDTSPMRVPLDQAMDTVISRLPFELAFYLSEEERLDRISSRADALVRANRNNVLQQSGIFVVTALDGSSQLREQFRKESSVPADALVGLWENMLSERQGQAALKETMHYLHEAADKGTLDGRFLHNFWIRFQQAALNASGHLEHKTADLIPLLAEGENARTLEQMEKGLQQVTRLFSGDQEEDQGAVETVERARRYVEDNLDQPLGVSDVADALYLNPDYLSRAFKASYGIPLKEYITKAKMETAQTLLRTTRLPVNTIAARVGYDNFPHFSYTYKKVMGISPTEERK